jgi:hypothetical protein
MTGSRPRSPTRAGPGRTNASCWPSRRPACVRPAAASICPGLYVPASNRVSARAWPSPVQDIGTRLGAGCGRLDGVRRRSGRVLLPVRAGQDYTSIAVFGKRRRTAPSSCMATSIKAGAPQDRQRVARDDVDGSGRGGPRGRPPRRTPPPMPRNSSPISTPPGVPCGTLPSSATPVLTSMNFRPTHGRTGRVGELREGG